MSQLQQDLDALLGEVDAGWDNHGLFRGVEHISHGVGGCLLSEMIRVVGSQPLTGSFDSRIHDMVTSLGFTSESAMYSWNDAQTDPDQVKRRVKDALNTL
jgi:hypothetical protein